MATFTSSTHVHLIENMASRALSSNISFLFFFQSLSITMFLFCLSFFFTLSLYQARSLALFFSLSFLPFLFRYVCFYFPCLFSLSLYTMLLPALFLSLFLFFISTHVSIPHSFFFTLYFYQFYSPLSPSFLFL